mmetsp:Transcript_45476/g.126137  ORF Transcript_45476/g.126137 Transcript_45476/m.126137 type:complete len:206 (-) Transcript_45476:206-823(-)
MRWEAACGDRTPHAEAVRERRENLEGLSRDRHALGRRHRLERAHVVQPVCQLHDDNPPIFGHRHKHRAKVLRLLVDLVERLGGLALLHNVRAVAQAALVGDVGQARLDLGAHHLGQLAHLGLTLDDALHRRAKHGTDLVEADRSVLDNVVQQPADDGRLVEPRARENHRHLHRVRDVRLTAPPSLPEVRKVRHLERHLLPPLPVG